MSSRRQMAGLDLLQRNVELVVPGAWSVTYHAAADAGGSSFVVQTLRGAARLVADF